VIKKAIPKIRDGSNDCLPYKNSYFAAEVSTFSVSTGGTVAVSTGATVVVSVVSFFSVLLLQAAKAAAIANTKKSFFICCEFDLFKQ
jgi:hypothetical protein